MKITIDGVEVEADGKLRFRLERTSTSQESNRTLVINLLTREVYITSWKGAEYPTHRTVGFLKQCP